jgi:hypothetical protein
MSTHTHVEVYLGNPITVASEARFLDRLRHDLVKLGVSARILANLHLGAEDRQVDFVVITADHVVQVELKVFPGPIVSGPKNGRWTVRVGAVEQQWRDPMWQSLQATHALSDVLHEFVRAGRVPGPRGAKFYSEIDTVVCAFPSLPAESSIEPRRHVSLIDYQQLLDILQQPGPSPAWSTEDWDAFGRHFNLYRDKEDSPQALIRQAGAAAVDEYLGRYLQAQADLPPLVATSVCVEDAQAPRPDLPVTLAAGGGVLLYGESGAGKTLWASVAAAALARQGHVPVWLAAEVSSTSFHMSAARAIAPYTSLSPNELLRAAEVAGRAVVFMVDDPAKAAAPVCQALLEGVRTARVRTPTHGFLLTAQSPDAIAVPECVSIDLLMPDDDERRAILAAYGRPELLDRCGAFVTPLDLSLAVACADELADDASTGELLDTYVDLVTGGDDRRRGALRALAWRLHSGLLPSLPRPEAARMLRRDGGLSDEDLDALLSCTLLNVTHGRVAFGHDRFEQFLAAEALLLATDDTDHLVRELSAPAHARLAADVIALESDETRLTGLLSGCTDAEVLFAAATGRLGALAARLVEPLLVDALRVACAESVKPGIRFAFEARTGFSAVWRMPDPTPPETVAQWAAVGRLIPYGRFIDGALTLLDHTDRLCELAFEQAEVRLDALRDQIFAATYAILPGGLPGSTIVHAATGSTVPSGNHRLPGTTSTALTLLQARAQPGPGALYLAAHLLNPAEAPAETAGAILRCLTSETYHLTLAGLLLAQRSVRELNVEQRQAVIDAVRALPGDNLALNGSIIDALTALDAITPARTLADILDEIQTLLGLEDEAIRGRMASGIISMQFETEAVGPYYEAVCELDPADRERLLIHALLGSDYSSYDDWIIHEFGDQPSSAALAALTTYVAGIDPARWLSPQEGMAATIAALRLLTAAKVPIPEPADSSSADPSWQAAMTIIAGATVDPAHSEQQPSHDAWAVILREHRSVLASFLSHVRGARFGLGDEIGVYDQILATMPSEAIEVLIWSLEHYDQTRPLSRHDHDLPDRIVEWLGQLGDRRAGEVLRRFTADPTIGKAAAAAVRQIESRAILS